MPQSHPVDILMNEHRLIEQVLEALDQRLANLHAGPFPASFVREALDFFRNYADGRHHFKEEECLFPMLGEYGLGKDSGPVHCMLAEHTQGRSCLAGIRENLEAAEAGSREASLAIASYAREYIDMLRQHIYKEDNILFQMARQILSPEDTMRLAASYAGAETRCLPAEPFQAFAARAAGEALPQSR